MLNITAARRKRARLVEINIAPLIDMVFILLIFFLVTTSFVKETGIEVNRPSAGTAVSKEKTNSLIGVSKDGRIYMAGREIDIRTVRANVERALAENPESRVLIVADKESQTGIVVEVMDGCRLAGALNVSLAAKHKGGKQ